MLNLHRGLNHQATIIATAPLIGIFGTICGIAGSFRGGSGSLELLTGALAEYLSEALYPAAYSLALAILTAWSHNYLTHQADALLAETRLPE